MGPSPHRDRPRRAGLAITLCTLASLLLAACGGTEPAATPTPAAASGGTPPAATAAPNATGDTILFGAPLGLTGSLAKESKLTQQGYEL
ncbi:MAG TPA: hypothetical protein VKY74_27420, partial [Chloroflexia bacterium]|nr:hypothetical protein [Chloroflexia bacterium]